MELVVQIHDQFKARKFIEFLSALDFVTVIRTDESKKEEQEEGTTGADDFFSYAGLWANRDMTCDSLRQQAWRRYSR